jgi:hypothetical protein
MLMRADNKNIVRGFSLVQGKHDPERSHYKVEYDV